MRDTVRNYSTGTFSWGSPMVFFVWSLPYSSNGHVTPLLLLLYGFTVQECTEGRHEEGEHKNETCTDGLMA